MASFAVILFCFQGLAHCKFPGYFSSATTNNSGSTEGSETKTAMTENMAAKLGSSSTGILNTRLDTHTHTHTHTHNFMDSLRNESMKLCVCVSRKRKKLYQSLNNTYEASNMWQTTVTYTYEANEVHVDTCKFQQRSP